MRREESDPPVFSPMLVFGLTLCAVCSILGFLQPASLHPGSWTDSVKGWLPIGSVLGAIVGAIVLYFTWMRHRKKELTDRVRRHLSKLGGSYPQEAQAVADAVHLSTEKTDLILSGLVADGEVERIGSMYRWKPKNSSEKW